MELRWEQGWSYLMDFSHSQWTLPGPVCGIVNGQSILNVPFHVALLPCHAKKNFGPFFHVAPQRTRAKGRIWPFFPGRARGERPRGRPPSLHARKAGFDPFCCTLTGGEHICCTLTQGFSFRFGFWNLWVLWCQNEIRIGLEK